MSRFPPPPKEVFCDVLLITGIPFLDLLIQLLRPSGEPRGWALLSVPHEASTMCFLTSSGRRSQ